MECKKPNLTQMQQRANAIFVYLRDNRRFCTKDELMQVSGCTNERTVREVINILRNKGVCVVSVSDKKGYFMARQKKDVELVIHAWKEIDSRIEELEKMKQCLVHFHDKAMGL